MDRALGTLALIKLLKLKGGGVCLNVDKTRLIHFQRLTIELQNETYPEAASQCSTSPGGGGTLLCFLRLCFLYL